MAQPNASSPASRLKLLRSALDRAQALPRGEELTFEPMMRLLKVSRPTLRDWCNEIDGFESSGCFERGANGVQWQFNPIAAIWFLIRHFEIERQRRSDKARRARDIAGGDALAEVPDDFDIDQTRKLVALSVEVQSQRERQRELIPAAPAVNAFRGVMANIQTAILTTPQELDPLGKMEPKTRELLDEAARRSALRARDAGKAWIEEQRADNAQSGKVAATG